MSAHDRSDGTAPRRDIGRRSSRVPSPLSAAAVGILAAIVAQVLIAGGEGVCEAVRGTSSCGGTGAVMLVAIAVLVVIGSARLMRTMAVPEPATTSVLGMALLSILMLTALLDYLFSTWMWVVLPAVAAVVYAVAAWTAVRLADAGHS
jgi:hypothetical protein